MHVTIDATSRENEEHIKEMMNLFFKGEGGYSKVYPGIHLKIIQSDKMNGWTSGRISEFESSFTIELWKDSLSSRSMKNTLFHELQHLVQMVSGTVKILVVTETFISRFLWIFYKFNLISWQTAIGMLPTQIIFNGVKELRWWDPNGKTIKSLACQRFKKPAIRKFRAYHLFPWELEADMMAECMEEVADVSVLSRNRMEGDQEHLKGKRG